MKEHMMISATEQLLSSVCSTSAILPETSKGTSELQPSPKGATWSGNCGGGCWIHSYAASSLSDETLRPSAAHFGSHHDNMMTTASTSTM